jgi:uncharacterized protein YjiS (DUF1127 family)
MSILNSLSDIVVAAFEKSGRRKALAELNTMSDRTLEDLGFSRALLSQGIQSWPWKSNMEGINNSPSQSKSNEIKAAIRELQSYNDRDLADLGISRGEIVDIVKNGRAA